LLNEPYLGNLTTTNGSVYVTLSEGEYFVLGDNREESFDSRRFGPIKQDTIIGRTWLRGYPLTRIGLLESHQFDF
jgi:signal peptidase I